MSRCRLRCMVAASCVALCLPAVSAADDGGPFSPLRPPAIPLAVRSPYVSTWLSGDADGQLPGSWPRFWADHPAGWQGLVRVDNVTHAWMGPSPVPGSVPLAIQTTFRYTATQSIFTLDVAGQVTLTATFLSPVWPNDLERQSLPFSYLQVTVASADGQPHDVQVYSDMTGEWTSPDPDASLQWAANTTNGLHFQTFSLAQPAVFQENSDMAQWGTWVFGSDAASDARTGFPADDTRSQFVHSGRLDNGQDTAPVFALARDLGTVSPNTPADVRFVLGLVQDHVVQFQGPSDAPAALAGLWTARHGGGEADPGRAASFVYKDWAAAQAAADALDAQIEDDTTRAGGTDYAALAALTVRQVFGSLAVVAGEAADRAAEAADGYLFMKEISSNGDMQTVDVIFPTHPLLLYLNATLVRRLLAPLYTNQDPATGGSQRYPNAWALHDLGVFPNAVGHPRGDDEAMPVEECGNMILLTLACARGDPRTSSSNRLDTAYLARHWPLLDRWAQFLLNDSLVPASQLSTDDFAGPLANQTNLALKGLLGVAAMAQIAEALGKGSAAGGQLVVPGAAAKARIYRSFAEDAVQTWVGLAADPDADNNGALPHVALAYGRAGSYGLLYNLFADRQLGLGLVPDTVYAQQSAFYDALLADTVKGASSSTWGLALDSRHAWAKMDWQAFAAAVASNATQAALLGQLAKFAGAGTTDIPLTDLYDAATGKVPDDGPTFRARPVVGGVFALLAMPGA